MCTVPKHEDTGHFFLYLTAFHWSLAQLTLGANELYPSNEWERVYSAFMLVVGMFSSTMLVAALSTSFIDAQLQITEGKQQIRQLKNFLRQTKVEKKLALRVMEQATRRLQQPQVLTDTQVPALSLLSPALRMELRSERCIAGLFVHPLFRLWTQLSLSSSRHLCASISVENFTADDELFAASSNSPEAFYLLHGSVRYLQELVVDSNKTVLNEAFDLSPCPSLSICTRPFPPVRCSVRLSVVPLPLK